jgi:hypothetical protein
LVAWQLYLDCGSSPNGVPYGRQSIDHLDKAMNKRTLLNHHDTAQNIRRVQRQLALANLPHSYRLLDLTNLRQDPAGRDLPAANDPSRGDIGK